MKKKSYLEIEALQEISYIKHSRHIRAFEEHW